MMSNLKVQKIFSKPGPDAGRMGAENGFWMALGPGPKLFSSLFFNSSDLDSVYPVHDT